MIEANRPIASALESFRARVPKAVQEREILRVVAQLLGADAKASMADARRQVLKWAQKRIGGRLPEQAWDGRPFEHLAGGRTILCAQIKTDDSELWAIRADDPDKEVAGRIWTHEVTIGGLGEGQPVISARQLVSSAEADLEIDPHVPGMVLQLSESPGITVGTFRVSAIPTIIDSEADFEALLALLESPLRKLPVCIASGDERAEDPAKPLIDALALARATAGLAHTFVMPAEWTYRLSDAVGKARSVYHGAVRVYRPGFDETANSFEHELTLGEIVAREPYEVGVKLRRLAASESLRRTRIGHDVIAYRTVRSAALQVDQERSAQAGAGSLEQVEILTKQVRALKEELFEAKSAADQSFDLAALEEERAKLAEVRLAGSLARIRGLEEQLTAKGLQPDGDLELPASWEEFADWCDLNFAGRCVLASPARRGLKKAEFEDIALAARCVRWLATTCRDRRMSGGGSLANIVIEEGIENAPCGADTFDFDFHGRRLTSDWHVKSGGNTRDPSRCLRIYYGFDEVSTEIVIADMPAHRRTGAS